MIQANDDEILNHDLLAEFDSIVLDRVANLLRETPDVSRIGDDNGVTIYFMTNTKRDKFGSFNGKEYNFVLETPEYIKKRVCRSFCSYIKPVIDGIHNFCAQENIPILEVDPHSINMLAHLSVIGRYSDYQTVSEAVELTRKLHFAPI